MWVSVLLELIDPDPDLECLEGTNQPERCPFEIIEEHLYTIIHWVFSTHVIFRTDIGIELCPADQFLSLLHCVLINL